MLFGLVGVLYLFHGLVEYARKRRGRHWRSGLDWVLYRLQSRVSPVSTVGDPRCGRLARSSERDHRWRDDRRLDPDGAGASTRRAKSGQLVACAGRTVGA